jgi:hypothetical protein
MLKSLFGLVFLTTFGIITAQQTECKVKLPAISGSYTGDCKKGLAQGHGIAAGVDRYEGEFIKGLPEGHGIYTWSNGSYYDGEWKAGKRNGQGKLVSRDSVLSGYWKTDRFQGAVLTPPFKISSSRNVQRSTIVKSVEIGNGVKIKLMLGGVDNSEVEDFSLAYSSGSEYRNAATYGIQNSGVPLDVTVRFKTWNQLHTLQYDVWFEFIILEPGTWNVTITNM